MLLKKGGVHELENEHLCRHRRTKMGENSNFVEVSHGKNSHFCYIHVIIYFLQVLTGGVFFGCYFTIFLAAFMTGELLSWRQRGSIFS